MTFYETERFVGNGAHAAFFRIRNHPKLGAKVVFTAEDGEDALKKELNIARILRSLGVSVPKYIDIIPIKISEYVEEAFTKYKNINHTKNYRNSTILAKEFFEKNKNKILYGLVMEYIEDDIILDIKDKQFFSELKLEYIYKKECEKIEKLGIHIGDSNDYRNILWSKSRGKLYFIDFESWNISNITK